MSACTCLQEHLGQGEEVSPAVFARKKVADEISKRMNSVQLSNVGVRARARVWMEEMGGAE